MSQGAKDLLERLDLSDDQKTGKQGSRRASTSATALKAQERQQPFGHSVSMSRMQRMYARVALPVVRALLRGGADVFATDDFGQSVMHRVAEGGVVAFAREILAFARGAAADDKAFSLMNWDATLAKILNAKDAEGQRPVDRALYHGHVHMVAFLEGLRPQDRLLDAAPRVVAAVAAGRADDDTIDAKPAPPRK